ncbi:MAG: phosphate regulon sensor histidine kinase PhoR [Pseudomonadota bacterium]
MPEGFDGFANTRLTYREYYRGEILQDFWFRVAQPLFYGALVALVLWGAFSATAALLFMLLLMLAVMVYRARQLFKLGKWLQDARLETIPEADGLWDEVFSRLYKMVKKHNQTKQALADELQYIQQATAALPEGVLILNAENRIEWCNLLAQRHFDLDPEQDVMQDITYLVRQPEFLDYLQEADFSEPLIMRPERHDDMVLSISMIDYGDDKCLLISRDVTQLERIEAMRRDFVANVSHELRTPLTVVGGFVENLQDLEGLEQEKRQRILQLMATQMQRMSSLVADLMTLSQLENDRQPLSEEAVDAVELIDEVFRDGLLLSNGQHPLEMAINSHAKLRGNRKDLRCAFANLVSNAIRHTPAGQSIVLCWQALDGELLFSVRDAGIGIAAQHLPRLTERFYRVDHSRSRDTGGTGLGLAIVKHIALRHQAKLEISSEEGKGSTFTLRFPPKRVLPA